MLGYNNYSGEVIRVDPDAKVGVGDKDGHCADILKGGILGSRIPDIIRCESGHIC